MAIDLTPHQWTILALMCEREAHDLEASEDPELIYMAGSLRDVSKAIQESIESPLD